MGKVVRRLLARFLFLSLLVYGLSFPLALDASAQTIVLNRDIELGIRNISQQDIRWATFAIGPLDDVSNANCGCYLAVLSTVLEYYHTRFLIGLPRFMLTLRFPDGRTIEVEDFSPRWLDAFLKFGLPGEVPPRPFGWGYKNKPPGCGVVVKPFALVHVATSFVDLPKGITFGEGIVLTAQHGFGTPARNIINDNLLANRPTIVIRGLRPAEGGGFHTQLIAGWDNTEKKYLVVDPRMDTGARPVIPFTALEGTYEDWENNIIGIIDARPLGLPTPRTAGFRLFVGDDPSPVQLLAISPEGRKTGFDPATQSIVQEDPSASYWELGAWADLFGEVPPGEPARFVTIDEPSEGTYRFLLIGTGDGPFQVLFSKAAADLETELQSLSGLITKGQVRKFEVQFSRSQPSTVTEVSNFTPEIRTTGGALAVTVAAAAIDFDANLSFDPDGQIASLVWDFGDGTSASGSQISHSYAVPGIYTVKVTATDNQGASTTTTRTVLILGTLPGVTGVTERVSVSSAEEQANGASEGPSVSADGRFVAFGSGASNLVPGDDPSAKVNVFVRDRLTGTTERVNVPNRGERVFDVQLLGDSCCATISADGRFVAFSSRAGLVPNDANESKDIYVRDRLKGVTERVSVSRTVGRDLGGGGDQPSISADGRFVAFVSPANDLVPNETNPANDVFIRNRLTGTTERVSVSSAGIQGDGDSAHPSISADGRFVAFGSDAVNLVPGLDPRHLGNVFVRDRLTGTTELVSLSSTGVHANNGSGLPAISPNGRFVAFISFASNLVPSGAQVGLASVYMRDRQTGTTELVSRCGQTFFGRCSVGISGDGRFVAFESDLRLVPIKIHGGQDIFVRDRLKGSTEMVSVSSTGEPGNNTSFASFTNIPISPNGRFVAFTSLASNLVPDDTNGTFDAFLRVRLTPQPVASPSGPYLGWTTSPEIPAFINFDASKSFDPPAGAALTARWDFGDGSPVVTASSLTPVQHSYAAPGKYTATLVVNNGVEDSDPATATVEVLPPLRPGGLSVTPSCGGPGTMIQISGINLAPHTSLASGGINVGLASLSLKDAEISVLGNILRVPTSLPDLGFQTSFTIPTNTASGTHSVALAEGPTASFSVPCPAPANRIPVPDAGGPYSGPVGVPLVFNGSRSNDPDGDPLTFTWHFGDGMTGTGVNPQHAYPAEGTFFVTLVVNDGKASSFPTAGTRSFAKVTVTSAAAADTVAPASMASLSPPPNAAAWNNTDVMVALNAMDEAGGSGVKQITFSASGAQTIPSTTVSGASTSITINTEGVTTISFFATDNAGNSEVAKTIIVKLDKTPPTITGSRTPLPNANGWNNTDVTVSFACTDGLSGLSAGSPPADTVVSSEGTNQQVAGTCQDLAGNSASAAVSGINIDKTPPTLAFGAPAPAPNAAGWNNTDVSFPFTTADNLSGVASTSSPTPLVLTTEGAAVAGNVTVTDLAGNMAAFNSPAVKIDKTPPSILATRNPLPNANGWNNTDVTVSFAAVDALSGVGIVSAPVTVTSEGAGQVVTGTAIDLADNSSFVSVTLSIDKTAPEAFNQFHPSGLDVAVFGRDSLSGVAPGALTPIAVVAVPEEQEDDEDDENENAKAEEGEDDEDETTELRTYKVLDLAGNFLLVVERVKKEGHEIKARVVSLQYNNGAVLTMPRNRKKFEWALEEDGTLKELEQKLMLRIGEQRQELEAEFDAEKNRTTIEQEPEAESKLVKPGLVLLRMATVRGMLVLEF